jgi:ABC-type polysaccharide/polyol phosphate export permease
MAIFCLALGFVYSQLLEVSLAEYLPFLAVGFVIWGFISGMLGEFPNLYVENGAYLKDAHLNPITILFRATARNVLILAHNILIVICIYVYFKIQPGLISLLAIPGIILVMLNLVSVGISLSILGARFRDVALINQSILQIAFFVSPITWMPHLIEADSWVLLANPIAYYMDLVRSPLLGHAPAAASWYVSLATLAIFGAIANYVYTAKRSRIAFWV